MNLTNVLCGSKDAEAIPVPILFKLVVFLYKLQIVLGEINFCYFLFRRPLMKISSWTQSSPASWITMRYSKRDSIARNGFFDYYVVFQYFWSEKVATFSVLGEYAKIFNDSWRLPVFFYPAEMALTYIL